MRAPGISQIVWSPLAQGVLTGKYRPGEEVPAGTRAASRDMSRFIGQWLTRPSSTRSTGCGRSPRRRA